jgi:hypothetical protein
LKQLQLDDPLQDSLGGDHEVGFVETAKRKF